MAEKREKQVKPGGLRGLLPEDFWEHHRAARRERLLSWRSLFDAAIERLEVKPEEAEQRESPKLIPEAFGEHRRQSCREELLACRGLLDTFVERLAERPEAKAQRSKAG